MTRLRSSQTGDEQHRESDARLACTVSVEHILPGITASASYCPRGYHMPRPLASMADCTHMSETARLSKTGKEDCSAHGTAIGRDIRLELPLR